MTTILSEIVYFRCKQYQHRKSWEIALSCVPCELSWPMICIFKLGYKLKQRTHPSYKNSSIYRMKKAGCNCVCSCVHIMRCTLNWYCHYLLAIPLTTRCKKMKGKWFIEISLIFLHPCCYSAFVLHFLSQPEKWLEFTPFLSFIHNCLKNLKNV